jgi:hypothetical protein
MTGVVASVKPERYAAESNFEQQRLSAVVIGSCG